MESFLVAMNAVIPFFCYIAFGYGAKRRGIVTEEYLQVLNQKIFRLFFPLMAFYNVYKADADSMPSLRLLVFTGASILIVEAILIKVVPMFVRENPKRGVIIQAMFRSNTVLFGIPMTLSVFGESGVAVAALLVTEVAVIYNTTSVLILEMFQGKGRSTPLQLAAAVARNPLLQGCVAGLLFFFLGIRIPDCLRTPLAAIADMTTPLAIFILGGTLRFSAIGKNLKYIIPSLAVKLLFLPFLILTLAYLIGMRELELFLLLTVYATPIAAASFPMAEAMGGDGELAGQFVVLSTAVSIFTMFLWIFALNTMGLLG